MTCQSAGSGGVCYGDSSGEVVCEEPEEDPPMYCAPETDRECETDSDCPREFECVDAPVACTEIACPEDNPDCNACSASFRVCAPKPIECETDDQCPADWSCLQQYSYECSGSGTTEPTPVEPTNPTDPVVDETPPDSVGSTDSASGEGETPTGTPAEMGTAEEVPQDDLPEGDVKPDPGEGEEACKEIPTTGYCFPDAFEGYGPVRGSGTVNAGGEADPEQGPAGSDSTTEPKGSDDGTEAPADPSSPPGGAGDEAGGTMAGGCTQSPSSPKGSVAWLLLLGLVPFLRRRAQKEG
jgi:hypothetical protein